MPKPGFVALDFELANPSHSSICSIGVARVTDGEIVSKRHWFVRPPEPYDFVAPFNQRLTGIAPSDLADARGFDYHGPNLLRNLDGGIVAGHNIAAADLSMFEQSWFAYRGLGPIPAIRYVDTVQVAQTLLPHLPSHRLNVVYEHLFGDTLSGHHSADVDAVATAQLLVELLHRSGTTVEDWVKVRRPLTWKRLREPKRPSGSLPIPARGAA